MQKVTLTELAQEQLAKARDSTHGVSAHTVHGGHDHTLRQTLVALRAGAELQEHESPGEATLHVIQGRVVLVAGDDRQGGQAGDLLVIPDVRHSLEAEEDSTVILTVAKKVD